MLRAIAVVLATLLGQAANAAALERETAVLTYPKEGTVEVDGTRRFKWNRVPGATYQLAIGTKPGAQDLFLSEIRKRRRIVVRVDLPAGEVLYARLWTYVGDRVTIADSTFSVADTKIAWLYPKQSAAEVNPSLPLAWTKVAYASGYRLRVGTTPGGSDLADIDCGNETEASAGGFPRGTTLYARVSADIRWRTSSADLSFVIGPPAAEWLYPVEGATHVDTGVPFEWTGVQGAGYVLWVGTTPGGNEIWQTGELFETTLPVLGLPEGQTVHATIWTHLDGGWTKRSISFVATDGPIVTAEWLHPAPDESDVATPGSFTWTEVSGALGFSIWIGTAPGTRDLFESGLLPADATSFFAPPLPSDMPLYARLWTNVGGIWRWRESRFHSALPPGSWLHPMHGEVGVDPSQPLRWTTQPEVEAFRLQAGTQPGVYDLADTPPFLASAYDLPHVPPDSTVYARLWMSTGGRWFFQDAVFTTRIAPEPSRLSYPLEGAVDVDPSQAFEWPPVDVARGYRLRIAPAAGGDDIFDSGELRVTRRFVPELPLGVPLVARLGTLLGGSWQETAVSFTAGAPSDSAAATLETAYWATAAVRAMATLGHVPIPGTTLAEGIPSTDLYAGCGAYATELASWLGQIDLPGSAHVRYTQFNSLNGHVLVEHRLKAGDPWRILDPTFVLTAQRPDTKAGVDADVISEQTRAGQWDGWEYVPLSKESPLFLTQYYLDYPLLFLNPAPVGMGAPPESSQVSPFPYLEEEPLPRSGSRDLFLVQCPAASVSTTLSVDGVELVAPCGGPFNTSAGFYASQVASGAGEAPRLFRARRFRF